MKVNLLDNTHLSNAVIGARTCWDSFHKGGNYTKPTDDISEDDKNLLTRLIYKNKHESISEHIVYTFQLLDVPRYVLQELVRHRIASYSVKSTRYTLKELKDEPSFFNVVPFEQDTIEGVKFEPDLERAKKYIDINENISKYAQVNQLEILKNELNSGKSLDEIKNLVPESYLTNIVWTINFRSLMNFLRLRTSKGAHYKIQELSFLILNEIPDSHKFLFQYS
jgi:thymidylate synthase, flavin-dependent